MNWEPLTRLQDQNSCVPDVLVVYGMDFGVPGLYSEQYLTTEELRLFESVKNADQKRIKMACRAATRWLLSVYLEVEPPFINFKVNRYGKPYLNSGSIEFNASHTETSFLIGISRFGRIGVDIESPDRNIDAGSIARYTLSPCEMRKYLQQPDQFYALWTRKEATFKALGTGIPENPHAHDHEILLKKHSLNCITFECPNKETASIVHRKTGFPTKTFIIR